MQSELCHPIHSRLDLMGEQFKSDTIGPVFGKSLCIQIMENRYQPICQVKCLSLLEIHNWIPALCHTQNHKPHLVFF